MSERVIECYLCGSYQGVIRDGKLHKKLRFVCGDCSDDFVEEPAPNSKAYDAGSKGLDDLMKIFGMDKYS